MPIYEFLCQNCGIQFEQLFSRPSTADNSAPCPDCGKSAQKQVSTVNHAFAHTPTGPGPQNTGVSQIDHNFDRVIGRDAEQKWAAIEKRQAYKREVLRDAARQGVGAGMQHLVRTRGKDQGAGDYRVITEPERKIVNARRAIASAVSKAARQTPING